MVRRFRDSGRRNSECYAQRMKVREIMSRDPYVCSPRSTLVDVAGRMRDLDVGVVPVCEGKQLKGMITDRDIAIRAVVLGMDPVMTLAEQVMSQEVVNCFEDQEVEEAVEIMKTHLIRRLVVLDRDDELVGVISLGDIAAKGHDLKNTGRTLKAISQPAPALAKLPGLV